MWNDSMEELELNKISLPITDMPLLTIKYSLDKFAEYHKLKTASN